MAKEEYAMMNIKKLRGTIIERLEEWVASMPDADRPIVGLAGTGKVLTAREIVNEVRKGTPFGDKLLERWIEMAVEREAQASLSGSG